MNIKSKNGEKVACSEIDDKEAHVSDKEMRLINVLGKQMLLSLLNF